MSSRTLRTALGLGAAALIASSLGIAAEGGKAPLPPKAGAPVLPEGAVAAEIVKYRHNHMEALGKHMRLTGMLVAGQVPFPDQLLPNAEAMNRLSTNLIALFPAGTGPDKVKSDSKAAIWSQWDKFAEAAAASEKATAALVEAARGTDAAAVKAAFDKTRDACGGCHETFKVDDEH